MPDKDEEGRVAELVTQFAVAAKLYFAGLKEYNRRRQRKAVDKLHDAAFALDAVGNGRREALARLFESGDAELCAITPGYLMNVMPERALAMAKKVSESTVGHAAFVATQTVFGHEWSSKFP